MAIVWGHSLLSHDFVKEKILQENGICGSMRIFQTLKRRISAWRNQPKTLAKGQLRQRVLRGSDEGVQLQAWLASLCLGDPRPQDASLTMCERLLLVWNFPRRISVTSRGMKY